MRPVRVDSKIPKSEISLRKESIRVGLADLRRTSIFSVFSSLSSRLN